MSELLVGRQPILNSYKETIGYELLYRALLTDTNAVFKDGNTATSQIFANTLFEMGLEAIVGPQLAFINFTRDFLVKDDLIQLLTAIRSENFDPRKIVLEVLEDITLDNELFQALHKFKKKNFQIALDDVISIDKIAPILGQGLVDLIKIDLLAVNRSDLPELVNSIKQHGILLLAEKVETLQDFSICLELGFDFFQGYFFYKPETIKNKNKKMDVSRLSLMRSLAATMDTQTSFHVLDPIISQDIGLSYKLLRLVNSGYYSLADQVKSIQQAIAMIGLQQLRSWMMLLMMATVDDKPHELTATALQRAKMCEMLGKALRDRHAESYFLIGLLSVLDAIMDLPMVQVVESLSLTAEITEALIYRKGKLGLALSAVIATEGGDWDPILQLGIKPHVWRNIYFESVKSTTLIMNEVHAAQ
ncbi:MAG: HDOD domain-containing protein [Chloroflexi bacterium]|nr:HDOD domain-containing protein [Chloroflexota bacterium]